MPIVAVVGKDTLKINGRIITEQITGDVATLTHPNDLSDVQTGKDGNSIYAHKNQGRQGELEVRVVLGGADDSFLNEIENLYRNDPVGFSLISGEFTKNVGDGEGGVKSVIYVMSGGVPKKLVDAKENADGETEQTVAVHRIHFGNVLRTIG